MVPHSRKGRMVPEYERDDIREVYHPPLSHYLSDYGSREHNRDPQRHSQSPSIAG